MKDRWLTLLLALGALAAFYFYFIGPKESEAEKHSRPLATEMRANGYFAIRRWLETEGIPVTELRQRYDWLSRARGIPKHGNLLITTIPHKRVMRLAEQNALKKWVRAGNTVMVAAGPLRHARVGRYVYFFDERVLLGRPICRAPVLRSSISQIYTAQGGRARNRHPTPSMVPVTLPHARQQTN